LLQAAELSRKLGAPEQLARAALGFGEPQAEQGRANQQLLGLLREALDGLSPRDSALRVRLLARLATERTFATELTFADERHRPERLSQQAVEMARRLGDVACLGSALHARWMALMAPGEQAERSALAGGGLQLAPPTRDRELAPPRAARGGGQLAGRGRHPGGRGRHRPPRQAGGRAAHARPPVDRDLDAGDG